MSSFTVRQFSVSPSPSSSLLSSSRSRFHSALSFPKQTNIQSSVLRARANSSSDDKTPGSGHPKPPNGTLPKSRREILLEYVKNVQPEFMELFVKRAPQQVVDAMRHTVTNMIGTLPPQFFSVTVTTVAESLAQLMYSVMMTGYMFKNAQYRLELQQSLEQVGLPDVQDRKDVPNYAPGTQKNVSGEVIRWNNVSGAEKIDAVKYIELLEAEIEELNHQVGRRSANGQNELLEYLKSLEPQNLKMTTTVLWGAVLLKGWEQNRSCFCGTRMEVEEEVDAVGTEMETGPCCWPALLCQCGDAGAAVVAGVHGAEGAAIARRNGEGCCCIWCRTVGPPGRPGGEEGGEWASQMTPLSPLLLFDVNVGGERLVGSGLLREEREIWRELTNSAGEDVVLAMNAFIKRLLAVSDPALMKTAATQTSAPELVKLLYWLMVVGYSIRNIEVRYDMERVLGSPPKLAELPPGENI
ncbi:hypothetical protein HHK36_031103 [Tetracentron sinense]|uniref:Uncharacterized protein n=1 Tax=Tetracentron sinense TaxID=13715 RepID=A0A834YAP3_TETSI|nr:hypothetical protein HHK36_031103 [Tetracentron sinense]